jgi:hypothetical protein
MIVVVKNTILLEIPFFVRDREYYSEFNIIEKRIVESIENNCCVILNREIEEKTNIYNMFYVIILLFD